MRSVSPSLARAFSVWKMVLQGATVVPHKSVSLPPTPSTYHVLGCASAGDTPRSAPSEATSNKTARPMAVPILSTNHRWPGSVHSTVCMVLLLSPASGFAGLVEAGAGC